MKQVRVLAILGLSSLALLLAPPVRPEDEKKAETKPETTADAPPLTPLEKSFVETLTNATMTGRWRLVRGKELGEEREEKYTISSVAKVGGDFWVVHARVQYGGKDVTVPVPVKVLWAGDTPVITLTKMTIPGLGTYTARVLIYEGLYTGTWSGSDHGGFLSGTIAKAGAAEPPGKG